MVITEYSYTTSVNNSVIVLFAAVFFIVGIIFGCVYLILKSSYNKKLRECDSEVWGMLIGAFRRNQMWRYSVENRDFCNYPVVEYTVNGKSYRCMWNYGMTNKIKPGPVLIRYNLHNPNRFYIVAFNTPRLLHRAMLIAAISCLCVGLIACVIYFVIVRF